MPRGGAASKPPAACGGSPRLTSEPGKLVASLGFFGGWRRGRLKERASGCAVCLSAVAKLQRVIPASPYREAMKMENEIRATRAGAVGKIHVIPGEAV